MRTQDDIASKSFVPLSGTLAIGLPLIRPVIPAEPDQVDRPDRCLGDTCEIPSAASIGSPGPSAEA
jgi:hypothetical protein